MHTLDDNTRVLLDKIAVGLTRELSKHLLGTQVETYYDMFINAMVYEIRGYVWGENQTDIYITYPADWWEAFKKRWFFNWMLKHWPVKYTTHTITPKILYPDMKISLPDEKHSLMFDHTERTFE